MTEFQGIPLNETKLLVLISFDCFLSLVLLGFIVWISVHLIHEKRYSSSSESKAEMRIKKLKQRAKNDPAAEKELARRLRRQKSKTRDKNRYFFSQTALLLLLVIMLAITVYLPFEVILDYQQKDYVIYKGSFEYVYNSYARYGTGKDIYLPDGTSLSAAPNSWNVNGTYSGTLVYAKRSGIVLGIEAEEKASP